VAFVSMNGPRQSEHASGQRTGGEMGQRSRQRAGETDELADGCQHAQEAEQDTEGRSAGEAPRETVSQMGWMKHVSLRAERPDVTAGSASAAFHRLGVA
jgi:hypothetical protein